MEKGEKENAAPGLMADARRHVQSGLFGREYTAPPPKPKKASKAPLAAESTNHEDGLQQPRLSPFGFVPSCDPAYVRDKKAKEETSKTGLARGASVDLEGDGGVSYNDRHRTAVVDHPRVRRGIRYLYVRRSSCHGLLLIIVFLAKNENVIIINRCTTQMIV